MINRITWLDYTKGILIILVVLGHSVQCARIQLGQDCLHDYIWRIIYSFHMPAFMAVSGYVAYRGKRMGGG